MSCSSTAARSLEERRRGQAELGVPVERVDASFVPGLELGDIVGAVFCATDGVGDPPAVTREFVGRARDLGVEVREGVDLAEVEADVRVIACGAWSAEAAAVLGVELPVRPLVRQLILTSAIPELPADLPMTIELETGFHFRRRGAALVLAMHDPAPRWGWEESVD